MKHPPVSRSRGRTHRLLPTAAVLAAMAGCQLTGVSGTDDAGDASAGDTDARNDASTSSPMRDASKDDTGSTDAAVGPDGGGPTDATGGLDAGSNDTGTGPEASTVDAADAGPVVVPPEVSPGAPTVLCVRRVHGPGRQLLYGLDVARDGRIAVVGSMMAAANGSVPTSVDFGAGVVPLSGENVGFVAVYDASCNLLWSRVIPNAGLSDARFDSAGNLAIGGYISATVDLGGGPIGTVGSSDVVVARFGPSYNLLFAKAFDSTIRLTLNGMGVDGAGTVTFGGEFTGTVNFGGGALVAPTGPGYRKGLYLAKLGPTGTHTFSRSIPLPIPGTVANNSGDYTVRAVHASADGQLTIAGGAPEGATIDLGGGPMTAPGHNFRWLARLTSGGGHVWSKTLPIDDAGHFSLLSNGDIGISARNHRFSTDPVDLGNGPIVGMAVLARLSSSAGASLWSKAFPTSSAVRMSLLDGAQMVSTLPGGVVLTTGFRDTINTGCGSLTSTPHPNYLADPPTDILLARLTSTGQCLYALRFGDRQAQGTSSVAVTPTGATVLAGSYHGTIAFGGVTLPNDDPPPTDPQGDGEDAFVAVFSK